jgi:hypothetical protein
MCLLSPWLWAEEKSATAKERFFELRTYTAAEGKLDALLSRFRDHTNQLFAKRGITIIGFWVPADEPRKKNTLIYILAFADRESREKSWKEFSNDAEWKKVQQESQRNGKLVDHVDSVYMTPTDFSPIK